MTSVHQHHDAQHTLGSVALPVLPVDEYVTPAVAERHTARAASSAVSLLVPSLDALAVLGAVAALAARSPLAWLGGVAAVLAVAFFPRPLPFCLSLLHDLPGLISRVAGWALLYITVGLAAGVGTDELRLVPGVALALLLARSLSYAFVRAARRRQWVADPVLVVGDGPVAADLIGILNAHPEYGSRALLDLANLNGEKSAVLGDPTRFAEYLTGLGVRRVVVVDEDHDRTHALTNVSRALGLSTYLVIPQNQALQPARSNLDALWGYALFRLGSWRDPVWFLKRTLDVVISGALLLVMLPLLVGVAIGVKLSSKGPVIFKQPRLGRDGKLIHMWKFRTFPVDHVDDQWSLATSECPLALGRFLRATSLDEIPQLFNILRGEMSLVGPRPERPHFAAPLSVEVPGYTDRHRLPMGLTGLAQVNGLWGPTSIEERVRFDNHYIEHWSLWDDVVIIIRTVPELFKRLRG